MLKMPAGFASLGDKTPYNWRYETTPQKHCNDRRMYWPRGKTWGGSSSINAMLYVRGHASDYDHWRQLGNEGWSYDDVLPYFKKAENNERWSDDFHGKGGPLNVAEQVDPNKLNEAFLHAAGQAGYQRIDDFNGANQEGVGYYQVTQKERQRWSAASAYLRPAVERNRNNVHVISNALVERIILDRDRAMGVRYKQKDGRDEVARCSREIILAGGAVNSPQLLMVSGIGPADHLKSVGIRPLHDLPGVGGNLQDHLDAALLQFCKTSRHLRHSQQAGLALPVLEGQEGPRHLADRRIGRLPQHAARPQRARHPASFPAGPGRRPRPHEDEKERL